MTFIDSGNCLQKVAFVSLIYLFVVGGDYC